MIDWGRVKELREEIGPADFDEVVEIFFEEIADVVARLPDLQEAEPLTHALHFLRSSALNLGFKSVATQSAEGEAQAESGAHACIDLTAIIDCYTASKSEFLRGIEQIKAA